MKLIMYLNGQVSMVQLFYDDSEMIAMIWGPSEVIRNLIEQAFTSQARVKFKLGSNDNGDAEY